MQRSSQNNAITVVSVCAPVPKKSSNDEQSATSSSVNATISCDNRLVRNSPLTRRCLLAASDLLDVTDDRVAPCSLQCLYSGRERESPNQRGRSVTGRIGRRAGCRPVNGCRRITVWHDVVAAPSTLDIIASFHGYLTDQ